MFLGKYPNIIWDLSKYFCLVRRVAGEEFIDLAGFPLWMECGGEMRILKKVTSVVCFGIFLRLCSSIIWRIFVADGFVGYLCQWLAKFVSCASGSASVDLGRGEEC